MADSKYGRLFTEADVRVMLGIAVKEAWDGGNGVTVGQITDDTLAVTPVTFPADEPLFLLRGQDRCARATVEHYAVNCDVSRVDSDHASAAHDAADEFGEWQDEHPDRVKAPG